MNILYHVVTYNIKNKDQCSYAIYYELKFDNKFSLSSGPPMDLLSVLTFSLIVSKKNRAEIISGLTCLWYIRANNRVIKRKHNKLYERRMHSNMVEYSTAKGFYFMTHDFKVPFFMPEVLKSNIILHQFHVDNNKGESVIGYDIKIGRDLMIQLGLMTNFNHQGLQWDGATGPMKYPNIFLGQTDLTGCEMRKVLIQTAEPVSARGDTEIMMNIIDSIYSHNLNRFPLI